MAIQVTEESRSDTRLQQVAPARSGSLLRWLLVLLFLIVAAAAFYFLGWRPRERQTEAINQEAEHQVNAVPRMNVAVVKRAPASSELLVPGTTLPLTEAYIYARASGYVSKRLVDIGDHVKKGQLMATIDAPDLDRQVAQARSSLAQSEAALGQVEAQAKLAELTWNRWKVLVARGVFSKQEGDQQEANFRVAESNVAAAKSSIEANRESLNRLIVLQQYEQVVAPFSGVVTARNVDVGTLINSGGSGLGSAAPSSSPGPSTSGAQGNNQGSSGNLTSNASPSTGGAQGGQMFSIAAVDRLRVLVSVPEAYTSLIRVGQQADLVFQERGNAEFHGRVTRTSASIDQNTRTLLVELQVANNGTLVPGMYVTVNFINVKAKPALMIPGAAIVVRNAKNMVAKLENNIVHLQPIAIGRDYGDQSEVLSGLNEGDAVVLDVTDQVQDGAKIEPQYEKEKPQQAGGQRENAQTGPNQYGNQQLSDQAQKSSKGGGAGKGKSGKQNSGDTSQSSKQ